MPALKKISLKENFIPTLFIVSGPAGAGKTTILKNLFRTKFIKNNFLRSISFTTRKKRKGEKQGKDYFFVDKKTFLELKKKNFFLETQKVLDDYYGSPRQIYEQAKEQKKNILLCIDIKGGLYLKKNIKDGRIFTIFLLAPTREELCKRLNKRKEDRQIIKKRISLAKKEIALSKKYDCVIVNKNIVHTTREIKNVIKNFLQKIKQN